MLTRLFSDGLFNLADKALNFACVFLDSAISFQVGTASKVACLLLNCAFDFVELACCLIVCARFHHGSLLCSVVAFDSSRSVDGSLRLDCLRPGKAIFGEVSLPDAEPCIDQYP